MPKLILFAPPTTPVEHLLVKFRKRLNIPDPGAFYVTVGVIAANMLQGSPCWLMLVGPPGSGKTELLNCLLGIPHVIECADIMSPATFLSGTPARDKAQGASGGLLRLVGDHGGIVMNDMTSLLAKADRIAGIMAVFRECFSGRWTRHLGTDGGLELKWTGKLALVAGVTNVIDHQHSLFAELGERWIYYRLPPSPSEAHTETRMSLENSEPQWRDELRSLITEFFESLEMKFDQPIPRRGFTNPEKLRIYHIANLGARCRSAVARDSRTHELLGASEPEVCIRLATVLGQLLLGMERIGVNSALIWRLLAKVALDSMPRTRKIMIETVGDRGAVSVEDLGIAADCSLTVAKRVAEDLRVLGIFTRVNHQVRFSEWMRENYRIVIGSDTKIIGFV